MMVLCYDDDIDGCDDVGSICDYDYDGSVYDYDIDHIDVVDDVGILVHYRWSATGAFNVGGISLEPLI